MGFPARSSTPVLRSVPIVAPHREQADLVAVGSHGHSRIGGILLGSVATGLVHEVPGVNPPG